MKTQFPKKDLLMVLSFNAQVRQTLKPTVFGGGIYTHAGFFKCSKPTAFVADFGDASTQGRGMTATNNFTYILAGEIVNKLFLKGYVFSQTSLCAKRKE